MWTEPILHVDMDSFFVEVERLSEPSLRRVPVAVGGTGPRGVIASASYEAREFGVHSAQPTSVALRLCPQLKLVSPRHSDYSEVSADVFEIFRSFSPIVEGLSLDEAFLDITGLQRHFDGPVAVGESIRWKIRDSLGLPASVGVAATKFVAKLASEAAKPDGIKHVPADEQRQFLSPLPADSLWGVGPATLAGLERLGIRTVGELSEIPEPTLISVLGPSLGAHLHQLANGIDPRPVVPDQAAKSVSVEETYDVDLTGHDVIEAAVLAHAQRLAGRLRRADLSARTITVKMRYADFQTPTRSRTVGEPISGQREIFAVGSDLLGEFDLKSPVRLIGLAATGLVATSSPAQGVLGTNDSWDRVDDAVEAVRERFGDVAVKPARLVDRRDNPENLDD